MNNTQKIGFVLVIIFGVSMGLITVAIARTTEYPELMMVVGGGISFLFGFKVARSIR